MNPTLAPDGGGGRRRIVPPSSASDASQNGAIVVVDDEFAARDLAMRGGDAVTSDPSGRSTIIGRGLASSSPI